MALKIEAFDLPETHEVVGFGRLLPALGTSNELGVEIILARVADPIMWTLDQVPVKVRMGCGQLGLAPIGSRWREAELVGHRRFGAIQADVTYFRTATLGELLDHPAPSAFSLARDMPCYLLKVASTNLRMSWMVVPVAEVIRALFGVSSEFLVQLFCGLRSPEFAPDSGFFHRPLSGWLNETEGCFRLACTRNPSDMEAVVAAWVLADPLMRTIHDSVFKHRQGRTDAKGASPIGMQFPTAAAKAPWTFEGSYLPTLAPKNSEKRPRRTFLARRILAIPLLPPFKRVEVSLHRVVSGKHGLPTGKRVEVRPGSPIPRLQEGEAAGTGLAAVAEEIDGAVLLPPHEIEVVHLPPDASGASPPALTIGPEGAGFDGSTGDVRPGGQAAHVSLRRDRPLLLSPQDPREARSRSREATWQAVAAFALSRKLPILHGSARADGSAHLERVDVGKRSFDMLLVCVRIGGSDVFVADVGTESGDERSVGLLRRSDGAAFDPARDVPPILAHAALVAGHWRSQRVFEDFEIVTVSRRPSGVWDDPAKYLDLIVERLKAYA